MVDGSKTAQNDLFDVQVKEIRMLPDYFGYPII
jgi:hypothetical protein